MRDNKNEQDSTKKRALSYFSDKMKSGMYDSPNKVKMAAKSSMETAAFERKAIKTIPTILAIIAILGSPFAIIKTIEKVKENIEEVKKKNCTHKETLDFDTVSYDYEGQKMIIKCTYCEKDVEFIPNVSEIINEGDEPTCESEGYKYVTWTFPEFEGLDKEYGVIVPKIDHDLIVLEKGYEATCYGTGLSDKTQCSMCETIYEHEELPKTTHIAIDIPPIESTCLTHGFKDGTKCKFCDLIMTQPVELPLSNHKYETSIIEPTDTESGCTYHECKYCGDNYSENITEPLFKSKANYKEKTDNYNKKYLVLTGVKEGITSLEIPESIDDIPFKEIAPEAFSYNKTIQKVILPEGLKVIGENAFSNASNLQTINFPSSLTTIGAYAFYNCKLLSSDVKISSSVNFIERAAFYNCSSIVSVFITEGVQGIEREAFYGCTNLLSVLLPSTMQSINDSSVFENCNNILEVRDIKNCYSYWPNSIVYRHASYYTKSSIFYQDGFAYFNDPTSNKYYMVSCGLEGKEITLPSQINGIDYTIRQGALVRLQDIETLNMNNVNGDSLSKLFNGNIPSSLKTINIDSTGTIKTKQFEGCKSLEKITISDKITTIYPSFYGCDNVKEVTMPGRYNLNYLFYHGDGIYDYSSANVYLPTNIKKVTVLGTTVNEYFMYNNSSVEEIVVENGIVEIDSYAFSGSTKLRKVTLANTVESIGYRAFYNCVNLTQINIPSSVTYLDENAFEGCPRGTL